MSDSSDSRAGEPPPAPWVQRLWAEMRREYGAAFDRQWQCPADVDPRDHVAGLMQHWARKLGQFKSRPHAIRFGLDNLPPHPPSLPEFVALCKQAPDPPVVMIRDASRKPDPARLAEIIAKMPRFVNADPLACARMHLERLRAGEKLTQNQIELLRAALPHEIAKEPE